MLAVIQKKERSIGVCFKAGSLLPVHPEFEFLRESSYEKTDNTEGFRIKEDLFLPESMFKDLAPDLPVGCDVTEWLGVRE